MKRNLKLYTVCLLAGILLLQCKKEDGLTPGNSGGQPRDTTGQMTNYITHDTTIMLDDGHMSLVIPAGAMPATIHPSITSSPVSFSDTSLVLRQFRLLPEGTKFKKVVTLVLHYDSAWLKGYSPYNIGICFQYHADGKWYMPAGETIDTFKRTVSVPITHFSDWSIYSCFHLYMQNAEGDISRDNSRVINMQTAEKGKLWMMMDLPPVWADEDEDIELLEPLIPDDPQKDGDIELLAPLIPVDKNQTMPLKPDAWSVNGVANGSAETGTLQYEGPNDVGQEIFGYTAPKDRPDPDPVTISAMIQTKSHGRIYLLQDAYIGRYGYQPAYGITSLYYLASTAGNNVNMSVKAVKSGDLTVVSTESVANAGGKTITEKTISQYDGNETIIEYWPSSADYETYAAFRIDPAVSDSSFTGFPIICTIPDNASAGTPISFEGSKRIYIETSMDGVVGTQYTLNVSNQNGKVDGFETIDTDAGAYDCIKITFNTIVKDTIVTDPGRPHQQTQTQQLSNTTTEWLARGIGLVKETVTDQTGTATTLLSAVYRDEK